MNLGRVVIVVVISMVQMLRATAVAGAAVCGMQRMTGVLYCCHMNIVVWMALVIISSQEARVFVRWHHKRGRGKLLVQHQGIRRSMFIVLLLLLQQPALILLIRRGLLLLILLMLVVVIVLRMVLSIKAPDRTQAGTDPTAVVQRRQSFRRSRREMLLLGALIKKSN